MKKLIWLLAAMLFITAVAGCGGESGTGDETESDVPGDTGSGTEAVINRVCELLKYKDALEIFTEGTEAEILDIETGITFKVKRVTGGFNTLADVETLTLEDTNKLLEAAGGVWDTRIRRPVVVTIGDKKIAASLTPFEHSGSESFPFGEIIDNRSGATGRGVNLDSIRENGMTGVVDIFFFNSLTPGVNRVDEGHQKMVEKAYDYEG